MAELLLDLVVPESLDGERIDKAVAFLADISRSKVNDMLKSGLIKLDGSVPGSRSQALRQGQRLLAHYEPPVGLVPDPDVEFRVVHEDDSLIVVDKPPGLVVHHGSGHALGTLVDGLISRYPDIAGVGDPGRPGIVHRLDKGTSGLMVVARNEQAYNSLVEQLSQRKAVRVYWALAVGDFDSDLGEIEAPIGRSASDPTKMVVSNQGRPARTSYEVIERFAGLTLVEATLHTGRTHQIRVHLAAIGRPVVGDIRYGKSRSVPSSIAGLLPSERQFLHAHRLTVEHPDGRKMTWDADLPDDLAAVLDKLRTAD